MVIPVDEFAKKLPYELIPTNLEGAFTSHCPQSGFDPNNASASELMKCGIFVPRPSVTDAPELHAAWQRVFSKHWRPEDFIIPELECKRGITHNRKNSVNANSSQNEKNEVPQTIWGAWGGVTIPGTWAAVFGTWIVPTVSKSPEGPGKKDGDWESSSWVGIDGAYHSHSTDVLQAGVRQQVEPNGHASYVVWYEWFVPSPPPPQDGQPQQKWPPEGYDYINPIDIPNLLVNAGDRVSCYVQYINGVAGGIFFGNETNGKHTRLTLAPPPGATFNGASAEWIMELPGAGEPDVSLPEFSDVQFTSAFAFGADGRTIGNPISGDIARIEDASNKALTDASAGDESVTITRCTAAKPYASPARN